MTCDHKRMHKDMEQKAVHRRHTEMAPWCKAAFTAARHDVSHLSRLFFFPVKSPSSHRGFQCNSRAQVYFDHPLIHLGCKYKVTWCILDSEQTEEEEEGAEGAQSRVFV